jgi:dihydrofolate synthase / folylpolyglutamate synthase
MKYSEAIDYLDSKIVLGVKPSLGRIEALCSLMGNPERAFDSIQVTGTNGKTSVSLMVAAILTASGYRTGLYTSPHLETVRERMSINGRLIGASDFSRVMEEVQLLVPRAEKIAGERVTYFELVTALAYLYFSKAEVDVVVLEAGMGGRWDATNVVECDVAVITNIELDHVAELGDTREKIAFEKVGIIDEGSMAITAEGNRDILMLIAERCREVGADLRVFGRDFRLDYSVPYRVPGETPAQIIGVRGLEGRDFRDVRLPMVGKHQAVNASCAIAAAQAYTDPRETTEPDRYREALESVSVPGRLEFLAENPLIVTDGAHNPIGADRLAASLSTEFDYEKLILVVAILQDKDARGILRILGSVADELVVTENRSARSHTAKRLAAYCRMEGIRHHEEPDFAKAVKLGQELAGPDGMVCITGSLYTVSEARILFRRQKASREMRQDR